MRGEIHLTLIIAVDVSGFEAIVLKVFEEQPFQVHGLTLALWGASAVLLIELVMDTPAIPLELQ